MCVRLRTLVAGAVVLGTVGMFCAPGLQERRREAAAQDVTGTSAAHPTLPTNPQVIAAFGTIAQHIERQEWDAAIGLLQQVLDLPDDHFLPGSPPISVKEAAALRLSTLPHEGRALYQRQHNDAAAALVEESRGTGSMEPLQEAVRRYFATEAGLLAAYELATFQMDRGARLPASRLFDRLWADPIAKNRFGSQLLLRSALCLLAEGANDAAVERLRMLKQVSPRTVTISGRDVPLFEPAADPIEWAKQFLIPVAPGETATVHRLAFRGDESRNRLDRYAPPVGSVVWSRSVVEDVESFVPEHHQQAGDLLTRMESEFARRPATSRVLIPAAVPVVVDGRVIFRGPDKLKSVRADDGSWDWLAAVADLTFGDLVERDRDRLEPFREVYFGQRAWRDLTSAAVSTDGERVYTILDSGMLGSVVPFMPIQAATRQSIAPFQDNRLQAVHVRGGRQAWSIGGAKLDNNDEFAGLFFLGAPLAHEGRLYCLCEDRGQVQLLVLDPSTPKRPTKLWSLPLLNLPPRLGIEHNELRRTAGLSPACQGDVLICPTGAGRVIAVDLALRRLMWIAGYTLPQPEDDREQDFRAFLSRQLEGDTRGALDRLLDQSRWHDGTPLVHDGKILLTAPESEMLVCLRMADGLRLWEQPRGQRLYLAGAAEGKAVIVGQTSMESLHLNDGTPVWNAPTPIPAPSGYGYRHQHYYTLPLLTGEVATVDLRDGRLVGRSPLGAATVPGNLVPVDGRIVFQSGSRVAALPSEQEFQEQIAQKLSADASDSEALALRGEIRLHRGEIAQGLDDLKQSLAIQNNPRTRAVLLATLLDALRTDFPSARKHAEEIESLVRGTSDEGRFRRLYATGLQLAGEHDAAFDQYLQLAESAAGSETLEPIDNDLAVRIDRWAGSRLVRLLNESDAEERARMLSVLGDRLKKAIAEGEENPARLEQMDRLVRGTPLENTATLERVRRLPQNAGPLTESLLRRLLRSEKSPERPEAVVRLARLYLEQSKPEAVMPLLDELRGPLSDVVVLEGKTGAEWLRDWEADETLREQMTPPYQFPRSPFHIESVPAENRGIRGMQWLPVIGAVDGPFHGWAFYFDPSLRRLLARDRNGFDEWGISLASVPRGEPRYVMVQGHLVLFVMNNRLLVIDALIDGTEGKAKRLLLDETLNETNPREMTIVVRGGSGMVGGWRGASRFNQFGVVGGVGPLTGETFCYQRGTELYAVDPFTGRLQWQRSNVPIGCEILADEEYLVLRPFRSQELIVLRADDGEEIARRPLPAETVIERQGGEWGRLLLTLDPLGRGGETILGMYDPVTDDWLWRRNFPQTPQWTPVDGTDLAVIDNDGNLVLIDPRTGQDRWRATLRVTTEIESLVVIDNDERLLVCANAPLDPAVQSLTSSSSDVRINGILHSLDRDTGKIEWWSEVQSQIFNREQPVDWPVLVLAARQRLSERRINQHARRILDKQTGLDLLPVEDSVASEVNRPSYWDVNRTTGQISLTFGDRTFIVQCGEPSKAAGEEAAKPDSDATPSPEPRKD